MIAPSIVRADRNRLDTTNIQARAMVSLRSAQLPPLPLPSGPALAQGQLAEAGADRGDAASQREGPAAERVRVPAG
ncbi:MAG: hypothetical protein WCP63_09160 [Cyanobium sp. ELA712]